MPERIQHTKALIFDWDDTKVDTLDSCVTLYENFARHHNLPIPSRAAIEEQWGKPVPEIFRGLFPDRDNDEIMTLFNAYVDATDFCIRPFPYAESAILELREMEYVLGVLTSGPRRSVERTRERHLNLPEDTYHFFHTAEDCVAHKPDPRAFDPAEQALQEIGISLEEAGYVGDSMSDYLGALSRGMLFIAVTSGRVSRDEFIDNGVDEHCVLKDLSELPALMRKYWNRSEK